MKKSLLFVLLFICSSDLFAQFKLSPEGIFINEKTGKDFLVNTYEGVSKDILYKFAENKVIEIFISPKDVISKSKDMISILGVADFESKEYSFDVVFSLKYKILIHFKENKIRYSVTPISLFKTGNGSRNWEFDEFYKKDEILRKPRTTAYNDLNDVVNKLIAIFFYINEESMVDWE